MKENKDEPKLAGRLLSFLDKIIEETEDKDVKQHASFLKEVDLCSFFRSHGQKPLKPFNLDVAKNRVKQRNDHIDKFLPLADSIDKKKYINAEIIVNNLLKEWIEKNQ
jgi:hypothetical protein